MGSGTIWVQSDRLQVQPSMLHLWNRLKVTGKGHCRGWHLLPFLIQHHCRPLPEGSVPNSSLTLPVCSKASPPIYFGFCDPETSTAVFQVHCGSFHRKLLFPHTPQKPLDIRSASCASLPTIVQEQDFRQKEINWNPWPRQKEGLDHLFQHQPT